MSRTVTVGDVIRLLDAIAPPKWALANDKIGLQVGNVDKPVSRVWVALEASPEVIEEAIAQGVHLIITHHALLFHPISVLDTRKRRSCAIQRLLSADIAVYSAHTNLDVAPGGVNDVIAERIGLQDTEILDVTYREALHKLAVYVPTTHLEAVRHAIGEAGAGAIGDYSHCTFSTTGVGTFLPGDSTTPFIGSHGVLERVEEARLETIVPESRLSHVLAAMLDAHPYEEVAYDVYRVEQPGQAYGIGRIGNLPQGMSLSVFAEHIRDTFGMRHIRYAGDGDLLVERVAVLGGSGSRWAAQSLAKGAQVLVTADVGHHEAGDAWQDGLAIVDATHAALEQPVCTVLADRLREMLHSAVGDCGVDIAAAPVDVDPFHWT
ncbi:Nif3-like dinuclear metal center hexameric protein [Alicyclobacillus fastidiosus]|uniref:GTP cyclohydrolase 1 type 2 homolog n=1 Tax=Alicyclobacillus fastidiosus TaxID=392011 RepID=A0ABY6ZNR5_9BACL|nr:Nif3-like dinuclear metal center hexameric protein [Alicyclobacillus fastidiosus]WAH43806.1 Nif3-like dinuclear metal center hexameric protein [Alicyclobacillus fastidiosus]GMA60033.1 GTP cyclohydrolase 1 type 2 [Alicyclobacillus fastidiosus]